MIGNKFQPSCAACFYRSRWKHGDTFANRDYLVLVDGKMYDTSSADRRLPLTIHEIADCGAIKDHSENSLKREFAK